MPFFPCAHERQYEALGFMDRRCGGQVERKSHPFAIEYSYIGMAAINSTFTDCLESHKDGNRHFRRALAIPVNYIVNGSLCAVDHPAFFQPSKVYMTRAPFKYITAWEASMSVALTPRASLPPMWEASSRRIRLALVSEARSLGYAIFALKLMSSVELLQP